MALFKIDCLIHLRLCLPPHVIIIKQSNILMVFRFSLYFPQFSLENQYFMPFQYIGVMTSAISGKVTSPQRPSFKFFKAGAIHDITDMLLSTWSVRINIFFYIVVSVENDFDNAVFIHPLNKVLTQTGIPFPCSPEKGQAIIFCFTACPCSIWTV